MDNLIYLIILGIFILISLIDSLFINWRLKKNSIIDASFKKTFLISIFTKGTILLVLFILPLILKLQGGLKTIIPLSLIGVIVSFFVFKKLLLKYYIINLKQTIKIFIQYLLFLIIILGSPLEVRFTRELYTSIISPDKIEELCYKRGTAICEPSFICEYSDPCSRSSCLATANCVAKTVKQEFISYYPEGIIKSRVGDYDFNNNVTATNNNSTSTNSLDDRNIPRIMMWGGKVNQHWNLEKGIWETDSDGTSGSKIDKLTYCQKFYPETESFVEYKTETIDTWRSVGNNGSHTGSAMSYHCVLKK
jgi:hypothetical protein